MKKVRVKSVGGWFEISLSELYRMLTKYPVSTFEVKSLCSHVKSIVWDGERRCDNCGDLLDITSYRD